VLLKKALQLDTRDGGSYEGIETVTSCAGTRQCLGCGRCRHARMSVAYDSETPRVEDKAEMVTAASPGIDGKTAMLPARSRRY